MAEIAALQESYAEWKELPRSPTSDLGSLTSPSDSVDSGESASRKEGKEGSIAAKLRRAEKKLKRLSEKWSSLQRSLQWRGLWSSFSERWSASLAQFVRFMSSNIATIALGLIFFFLGISGRSASAA